MNKMNSALLRSALAIVLGIVLVLWPEMAVTYLVITIGILFILPGIFSLLSYFTRNRENQEGSGRTFPIEGAGSILLGVWLVVMPEFFVNILMYILGVLLILAGVFQIVSLIKSRKYYRVGWGYYVLPLFILITGILILAYPFGAAANTFVLFGVTSIVYGLSDIVNTYKFRKKNELIIDEE